VAGVTVDGKYRIVLPPELRGDLRPGVTVYVTAEYLLGRTDVAVSRTERPLDAILRHARADATAGRSRSIEQIAENKGIAVARADRVVWQAIVGASIFSLGWGGASLVGLPALAKLSLEAGSAGVGVLLGAPRGSGPRSARCSWAACRACPGRGWSPALC
jgi:hypothetical protein